MSQEKKKASRHLISDIFRKKFVKMAIFFHHGVSSSASKAKPTPPKHEHSISQRSILVMRARLIDIKY